MRLIDADKLKEKAITIPAIDGLGNNCMFNCIDFNDLIDAPTVDAEPIRHGKMCIYDEAFTIQEMLEETNQCRNCRLDCPNCG